MKEVKEIPSIQDLPGKWMMVKDRMQSQGVKRLVIAQDTSGKFLAVSAKHEYIATWNYALPLPIPPTYREFKSEEVIDFLLKIVRKKSDHKCIVVLSAVVDGIVHLSGMQFISTERLLEDWEFFDGTTASPCGVLEEHCL